MSAGKVVPLARPGEPAAASAELGDDELMLLARRGRGAAFDELVRRHQRRVLGVAARYVREPAHARDVAQNTFVALDGDRCVVVTGATSATAECFVDGAWRVDRELALPPAMRSATATISVRLPLAAVIRRLGCRLPPAPACWCLQQPAGEAWWFGEYPRPPSRHLGCRRAGRHVHAYLELASCRDSRTRRAGMPRR